MTADHGVAFDPDLPYRAMTLANGTWSPTCRCSSSTRASAAA
ncbi:MAG: hypothetical protein R2690_09425 [Acidimicrobiales bacterium]